MNGKLLLPLSFKYSVESIAQRMYKSNLSWVDFNLNKLPEQARVKLGQGSLWHNMVLTLCSHGQCKHLLGSGWRALVTSSKPRRSGTSLIIVMCYVLCVGRIWWKLQSHNSILKMYFLACAYWVVLITDQFWIKWFFGKKSHFLAKKSIFWKKMAFWPTAQHGTAKLF